jgi:hypothetical protein
MNAGVCTVPRGNDNSPRRAAPSMPDTLNFIVIEYSSASIKTLPA